jgi:hypothetical protein
VERWDGRSWAIVSSGDPAGSFSTGLNGVACADASHCFAVGSYLPSPAAKTLIESWNGTRWRIVAGPEPPGSSFAVLNGVSCPSNNSCFAVGFYLASDYKTLVEHWDGSGWSIMTSPNRTGSNSTILSGVACPNKTFCFAVGNYTATHPTTKTLVERWTGTSWSIMTSPNPTGSYSASLSRVACLTTTNCFAVGSATKTLIERYN